MTIQTQISDNGVNTKAWIRARGVFTQMPQAAAFTFRRVCDGRNGAAQTRRWYRCAWTLPARAAVLAYPEIHLSRRDQ